MLDATHYNEKLIFYIDVMGIGSFVTGRTSPDKHNELYDLYSLLGRTKNHAQQDVSVFPEVTLSAQRYLNGALKRSLISDTLLITLDADKIAYAPFILREITILQYHFLSRGLLRGVS